MTGEHGEDEKTPTAWAAACFEIMKQVDPGYKQKRSGKRVEYIRRDESGLLVSQSFLYHYHSYRHSFSVLFTEYMSHRLISPLRTRGRFNDNFPITSAYAEDLGIHGGHPAWLEGLVTRYFWGPKDKKIPGSPANLDDPFPMISKVAAHAEQHLLPFYRKALSMGSRRLAAVFIMALRMITELGLTEAVIAESALLEDRLKPLGFSLEELRRYHTESINISALEIALDRWSVADIPGEIKDACLALWNISEFIAVKDELPRIIKIVKAL